MRVLGTEAAINSRQSTVDMQGRPVVVEPVPISPKLAPSGKRGNSDTSEYPITEKVVADAVGRINKAVEGSSRIFVYSVHEKTNEIMIKVIDETTKEVIREIPPKKILDMVANMLEMAGLLVDERR
jgi:flagellar protein FlaG